ncbi:MAG: aminotransferase class I/II-fold pyridoxal phosphate-dependent enzyme [Hyphomicrobiaceae bacterium]|nr:aminotransferase class I/II-fold pyridoxal phosphate-dependent enzyme [Hyphomicrobiaceae bacterium]
MTELQNMSDSALRAFHDRVCEEFDAFRDRGLALDMTRGKPSTAQLDLSNALLRLPDNVDYHLADGSDARNYGGGVHGIPEARELFSEVLGAPVTQIIIGGNSSLALMHDCIVYALLTEVPGGATPWNDVKGAKFICPVPGYDRHFAICEDFGIEMVTVGMTGEGPDMDEVERLVADPLVKGMWCVPKYSNPTGETYSDDTIRRLASMKAGAPDFRLFWDNAYALHNLTEPRREILNILGETEAAGNPDRAFVFGSTSKITFGGGGLALFASSPANVDWLTARMQKCTIGPDKLNQLRHVRYLKDVAGLDQLMDRHRSLIAPKFEAIYEAFDKHLSGRGAAEWKTPEGGYFISVDVPDGCAEKVIQLCGDAGVTLTPAGSTYPYGHDPHDRNIRVAPTYPDIADVQLAGEGLSLAVLVTVSESLLAARTTEKTT